MECGVPIAECGIKEGDWDKIGAVVPIIRCGVPEFSTRNFGIMRTI